MFMTRRAFSTSSIRRAVALDGRPKPKVGAFRGGFMGFLLGVSVTGFGAYYYLFDEYRAATNVVMTDVTKLEQSLTKLESQLSTLESKVNKKSSTN